MKRTTGKLLGELESQVMEFIWRQPEPVSVKDVMEFLSRKRRIAYTTVMTIMVRLVNKGVLVRRLRGSSYLYRPKVPRERFVANTIHGIFSSAVSSLGQEVLTHFVKEIEKISPKKQKELLKQLEK